MQKTQNSNVVSYNTFPSQTTQCTTNDLAIPAVLDENETKCTPENNNKPSELLRHPPVSYFALYRFAKQSDVILMVVGIVAAIIGGSCTPLSLIVFGDMAQTFINQTTRQHSNGTGAMAMGDGDTFLDKIGTLSLYFGLFGATLFLMLFLATTCFSIVSKNLALLRQNVGWFDTTQDKAFVSRIAEDAIKVQEATGEKVGLCIFVFSVGFLCLINAFAHGWKLTLVILSSGPALGLASYVTTSLQSKFVQDEQNSYAKAGKVAEQAIGNIRTVYAFNGQQKELNRFEEGLEVAKIAGKKRGTISGMGAALVRLIVLSSYALAFWYGTKLVLQEPETYSYGSMLVIFFCALEAVLIGGQCSSYLELFAAGKGSAAAIYSVIDRTPEIDVYSDKGTIPRIRSKGQIEFRNLHFNYPSRMEVEVLSGLSYTVEPGQTVAIVGKSGCGKSTLFQLLQRFYDPSQGQILIDGDDINGLHLKWLRSQIGVVSQEPVLFNNSIYENIKFGKEDATAQEIEEAARQANAHAFISKLPKGYQTLVGDRGTQMSGGQKQRIAIARAIIRRCPILLLDEATSALDTQGEGVVQEALDRASLGRTTLIVAHRLSTIRNANVILVLSDGKVSEVGTHADLLEKGRLYYDLVTSQLATDEHDILPEDKEARIKFLKRRSTLIEPEDVTEYIQQPAEEEMEASELMKEASVGRMMKLNSTEWPYIWVGCLTAVIQGGMVPLYAIMYGEFLGELYRHDPQPEANRYALIFLGIGAIGATAQFIQAFCFTHSGEALTMRIRKLCFGAILSQEIGWFDDPRRSVGGLCTRLSEDAASIGGITGARIGVIFQALSILLISVGVSMYYSPKLGAVGLSFVPFMIVSTYLSGFIYSAQNIDEIVAHEGAAKVAVESIGNIRTVASLGKEVSVLNDYRSQLEKTHRSGKKTAYVHGFTIALGEALPLFAYATVLYYGAYLIENERETYTNVYKVAQALIFGSVMVGHALSFAPNYYKAKVSSAKIQRLLDRRPLIESSSAGLRINSADGSVEFKDVVFSYPTRPMTKVLNGLDLSVQSGKSLALVGHSGCGKSSCINLILRFYDPSSGTVNLDGMNVAYLNVDSLRSQMSIVSQEPALFDLSLRENIAYGDNSRNVDMGEIIQAAKMANIHNVIWSLPAQYETRVGDLGSQLSGGQKQRVAIARALVKGVKGPKILLLDEATSALDMESEKVVQDALNRASAGRTTITIAHRLASIQNADQIIVIRDKIVAEAGTHSELLQKRGIYYQLWSIQGHSGSRTPKKFQ